MTAIGEIYLGERGPVQKFVDRAKVIGSAAAYVGAGYLFLVEKPNDLAAIKLIDAEYKAGTCPEVQCGPSATDPMMRQEYFGVDSLGSLVLLGVATFGLVNRMARPQRWFTKHYMAK